jgi:hypothetical protein
MKSTNLKKSALTLAFIMTVGSVGFGTAFGYGSSNTSTRVELVEVCYEDETKEVPQRFYQRYINNGATAGPCTAEPEVAGISDSQETRNETLAFFMARISEIFAGIQSGTESGEVSNTEAGGLYTQLAGALTALLGFFR